MNHTEIARLLGYVAALGLGVYMTVEGVKRGDPALVASGMALMGTGGTAGGMLVVQQKGRHRE